MTRDFRLSAAVLSGKLAGQTSRWLRRGGGTTIPGDVAMVVDRHMLRKYSAALSRGCVVVTGTNGKTTTTGLLETIARTAGWRVVSNRSGANLIFGAGAAAISDARFSGHPRADIGVFEIDELHLPLAVKELQPRVIVVLNLLRDQLDRSGELETTAARVGEALRSAPAECHIVANVDDPLVYAQCMDLPGLVSVGVNASPMVLPGLPHAADARRCPHCSADLQFSRVILAHCGDYACPECGFRRPVCDMAVEGVNAMSVQTLDVSTSDGSSLHAGVGGMYNVYNVLAAYATSRALAVDSAVAVQGIASFSPRFGRQETVEYGGRQLHILLAKNPSGFDEVLRTADELGEASDYVIAINDGIADGRDVSWLWDVDFERLARSEHVRQIVVSGRRAYDMAVRLHYAGVSDECVVVDPDIARALQNAVGDGDIQHPLFVLPTYTAMLEMQKFLEHENVVPTYWNRAA